MGGDGFVAVGAGPAGSDATAGALAVGAPLLAEVALVPFAADVDGAVPASGSWRDVDGAGGVVPAPVGDLRQALVQ